MSSHISKYIFIVTIAILDINFLISQEIESNRNGISIGLSQRISPTAGVFLEEKTSSYFKEISADVYSLNTNYKRLQFHLGYSYIYHELTNSNNDLKGHGLCMSLGYRYLDKGRLFIQSFFDYSRYTSKIPNDFIFGNTTFFINRFSLTTDLGFSFVPLSPTSPCESQTRRCKLLNAEMALYLNLNYNNPYSFISQDERLLYLNLGFSMRVYIAFWTPDAQ